METQNEGLTVEMMFPYANIDVQIQYAGHGGSSEQSG